MSKVLLSLKDQTVVLRVIRHNESFVCGICRMSYADPKDAVSCLKRCIGEYFSQNPVITIRKGKSVTHRCRFCGRTFGDLEEATKCGNDCRKTLKVSHEQELACLAEGAELAHAQPMKGPSPRRWSPFRLKMKDSSKAGRTLASSIGAKDQKETQDENKAAAESTPAPNAPSAAAADQAAAKKEADAESKVPKGKFHRDGAKYVCNKCLATYFTKLEVEKCFDSHQQAAAENAAPASPDAPPAAPPTPAPAK